MSRDRRIHEQVIVAVCRVLGPSIASVGIHVENGIVQLSGVVDTPEERVAVERAVWSVEDVRAISQRLRARRSYANGPTDRELASDVLTMLACEGRTGLRVLVEEGVVTIVGRLDVPADRAATGAAVATVRGVRGVWMTEEAETRANADPSRIRALWN